jgi:type III restriction enzyme
MTGGEAGEELPDRRILINPREMKPNPAVPEDVWQKFLSLPSQTLPKRQARPVKRLTALAHELAVDGLLAGAGKKAHADMHKVLDAAQVRYAEEIAKARAAVMTVEGKTVKADIETKGMTFDDFVEAADYAVIEDAYKRAGRVISPDLATTYSEHLASKALDNEDPEDALIEAHSAIAAMGLVPDIKDDLDGAANKLANQWLAKFRVPIKNLSDQRQDVYREIREMSSDPLPVELARPNTWLQRNSVRKADGTEQPLEQYEKHLLCDEDGLFPGDFNTWESKVVSVEVHRKETIGWYRNPPRPSQDSLGVTYEEGGETKIVRPDFIFFTRRSDGTVGAVIVDPHGTQFGDSLPRLKGLARYVEENASVYGRVEVAAKVGQKFRVLDVTNSATRTAVMSATTIQDLYKSHVAEDYDI